MRTLLFAALAVAVGATPSVAQHQMSYSVAPHVGTLGVGVDVGIRIHPRISIRAGANVFPLEPEFTFDDIAYKVELPTPQFSAMVDLSLVGPLRATGGVIYTSADFATTGQLTGTVDIGGTVFQLAEVGTLTGVLDAKDIRPYLGLGFGNVATPGLGFFVDLGVAFQGEPTVSLAATGTLASDPTFLAELAQEEALLQADASLLKYYPVITVGLKYGF